MAFHFPLEAVLHFRKSLEHQQELRLRAANQHVARVHHLIEQMDLRRQQLHSTQTQELSSGTTVAEMRFGLLCEAELLRHLIRSNGRVVSRKSILEEVWGLKEDTDTRAIDNFVVRLRRYIEDDPAKPRHLLTVRGVGYRFLAEPEI